MKKTLAALITALCLILAGCTQAAVDSSQPVPEDLPVGGGFHADPIYGAFRDFETGEVTLQFLGQINYYDTPEIEEYVENLNWFTGLNFAVEIIDNDFGVAVEWLPEATLFDTEVTAAQFHQFEDNNALRWFMLDSLAELLRQYTADFYYTMDGGNDLVLEGLTPIDTFPAFEYYLDIVDNL